MDHPNLACHDIVAILHSASGGDVTAIERRLPTSAVYNNRSTFVSCIASKSNREKREEPKVIWH